MLTTNKNPKFFCVLLTFKNTSLKLRRSKKLHATFKHLVSDSPLRTFACVGVYVCGRGRGRVRETLCNVADTGTSKTDSDIRTLFVRRRQHIFSRDHVDSSTQDSLFFLQAQQVLVEYGTKMTPLQSDLKPWSSACKAGWPAFTA